MAADAVIFEGGEAESTRDEYAQSHLGAVVVLLPLRLFLAAGWLRAATEKVIDPEWWNGHKLQKFVTSQHNEALPFFRPVMDHLIAPGAQFVAIVVVLTQFACGIAIGNRSVRLQKSRRRTA